MEWVHKHGRMEHFMKDSGSMDCNMELERKRGMIASLYILVTGKMDLSTEMVNRYLKMELNMMEIG